jgi:hypothetical protein
MDRESDVMRAVGPVFATSLSNAVVQTKTPSHSDFPSSWLNLMHNKFNNETQSGVCVAATR